MQVAQYISSQKADAYVIVYSVEDRESFEGAIDRLYTIRNDDPRSVAVILVANKMDLVRNRIVQDDGMKTFSKFVIHIIFIHFISFSSVLYSYWWVRVCQCPMTH